MITLLLGAEPSIFPWTVETPKRKPPTERHPTPAASEKMKTEEVCAEILENNPSDHAGAASPDGTRDNTPLNRRNRHDCSITLKNSVSRTESLFL